MYKAVPYINIFVINLLFQSNIQLLFPITHMVDQQSNLSSMSGQMACEIAHYNKVCDCVYVYVCVSAIEYLMLCVFEGGL